MKKIYDPVHGFIHLEQDELRLIDSLPFQRLHYIHQLGCALFVYPGATHKRFEHSLGTMEVATRSFDQLANSLGKEETQLKYLRKVVRFAALCHDLGHLPFSHVAEKALLGDSSHEAWTAKLIESEMLGECFANAEIDPKDVVKAAVGPKYCKEHYSDLDLLITEIITGDFFGADRIDYLLRDAKSSGLPYGLFDYEQIIEMLRITSDGRIGMELAGIEACESLLLARYFMHKRIYQYPSVKAYGYHMAEFMRAHLLKVPDEPEEYVNLHDMGIITLIWKERDHPHAAPFIDRSKRFLAIPSNLARAEKPQVMDFPVVRGGEVIGVGSDFSNAIAPLSSYSWTYLPREDLNNCSADSTSQRF
ncbi:MAG: HD domain-containing protein [Candidatus Algichlamydia australiensis]|nr:HD domain-containing protein [Chlamydiales bacterium]